MKITTDLISIVQNCHFNAFMTNNKDAFQLTFSIFEIFRVNQNHAICSRSIYDVCQCTFTSPFKLNRTVYLKPLTNRVHMI